ncbi:glycosyltransferase family 2 protein [Candidatus Avelusimicrobium fimicolum]|uniref:glycosyltransferase family 2 protein n=1 Tax=Candidatus Avelusimicrobium fimicolum TaxID=3416216 RepID=UPI003D0FAF25
MELEKQLQIVLITYNRKAELERTLRTLLADDSPIKNCDITVLDNRSTDGTDQIIQNFAQTHPNLHNRCNKYNVGLGGNLIKAMELADKKYLWILCDDDFFDWTNWAEIEQAINDEYDLIMTSWAEKKQNPSVPYILNNLGFVPSGIYHTKHITDLTMQNAYAMAYNLFPFQAMGIKIVNEKGRIFMPHRKIVIQSEAPKSHKVKKLRPGLFFHWNKFNLLWGYVDSYNLIEDKKLRQACCDELVLDKSFLYSMRNFLSSQPFCWHHFWDIFCTVSFKQKIILLWALLCPLYFYRTDRGINIKFFFLKTKVFPLPEQKQ